MRLIDADALERFVAENVVTETDRLFLYVLRGSLICMPTIEAEPVRHGRWEVDVDRCDCEFMKCSVCGEELYDGDNDTIDKFYNYCPNCGAKMDGGTNVENA